MDGPPGVVGPDARYPAIPLLRAQLAASACIVLDDLQRPDERHAAEAWAEELPDFALTRLPLQKGAAVFRRDA